ncbi:MAG: hypothetical protein R3C28_26355 [Pirellulaceae bacterium]
MVHSTVDMNPHKHGKFIGGTGHPVMSVDQLNEINPSLILLLNPIYADEVAHLLQVRRICGELLVA